MSNPWPEELTVKEFAARERVTERTVRTWLAKGAIAFRRTPGGGIRILERRREARELGSVDMTNDDRSGSSL